MVEVVLESPVSMPHSRGRRVVGIPWGKAADTSRRATSDVGVRGWPDYDRKTVNTCHLCYDGTVVVWKDV